jgi:RecA-family ATPase
VFRKHLRALYISAEDSSDETKRKVAAACRQHKLSGIDISGLRYLGAEHLDEVDLTLVVGEEESASVHLQGINNLEQLVREWHPNIVAIDPLATLCPGGVNKNAVMANVIRNLKSIAHRHSCAIWIVHHTKKGGDLSSAEAIGGASAIVNHARVANIIVGMSESEAKAAGVPPSAARRHFRVNSAKSNFAPASSETRWFSSAVSTWATASRRITPTATMFRSSSSLYRRRPRAPT